MAPPMILSYSQALRSVPAQQSVDLALDDIKVVDEEVQASKDLEHLSFFIKLPPEIRLTIWRLLFRRDATIAPGWVRYLSETTEKPSMNVDPHFGILKDRYQWAERVQQNIWDTQGLLYGLEPDYTNNPSVDLTLTITSAPTPDQAARIARRERVLPFTFAKRNCRQIGCDVVLRGEPGQQFFQVVNRMESSVEPLYGVAMLRVCKKAHEECSAILYGENLYYFNTSTDHMGHEGLHGPADLTHLRSMIPGMPNNNGAASHAKLLENVKNLFLPGRPRPDFVANNPMLRWFTKIGRVNAAILTKVKIDGMMQIEADGPGFAIILVVLSNVLRIASPNLKELTLFMLNKKDYWKYEHQSQAEINELRIDEVVGRAVSTLPSLEVLRLPLHAPDYDGLAPWGLAPTLDDEWGRAVRLIDLVEKRASGEEVAQDQGQFDEAETVLGASQGWTVKTKGRKRSQRGYNGRGRGGRGHWPMRGGGRGH